MKICLVMDPYNADTLAEAAGALLEQGVPGDYRWYEPLQAYAIYETQELPRGAAVKAYMELSRWAEGEHGLDRFAPPIPRIAGGFAFADVNVCLTERPFVTSYSARKTAP